MIQVPVPPLYSVDDIYLKVLLCIKNDSRLGLSGLDMTLQKIAMLKLSLNLSPNN